MISSILLSGFFFLAISSNAQESARTCGLSGSVEQRIQNCKGVEEEKKGFELVSKDSSGHYLVLDKATNLVWSQHLTVKQQLQYYGKVDVARIRSICRRFQPFGMVSSTGWRLPTVREIKKTVKRGNRVGTLDVLSANSETQHRLIYNGYSYDDEFRTVPVVYSEKYRTKHIEDGSLEWLVYRCVIDRDLLK